MTNKSFIILFIQERVTFFFNPVWCLSLFHKPGVYQSVVFTYSRVSKRCLTSTYPLYIIINFRCFDVLRMIIRMQLYASIHGWVCVSTVPEVGLQQPCRRGDKCQDDNAACIGGLCVCVADFFQKLDFCRKMPQIFTFSRNWTAVYNGD